MSARQGIHTDDLPEPGGSFRDDVSAAVASWDGDMIVNVLDAEGLVDHLVAVLGPHRWRLSDLRAGETAWQNAAGDIVVVADDRVGGFGPSIIEAQRALDSIQTVYRADR